MIWNAGMSFDYHWNEIYSMLSTLKLGLICIFSLFCVHSWSLQREECNRWNRVKKLVIFCKHNFCKGRKDWADFNLFLHLLFLSHRKLSHPKLVQLYGVCFENTPICLVFEFMEHGCLSDYLRSQRGSFSKETLLGMCLDVCEGMAYLEQNSVIHRDLVRCLHTDFPTPTGLSTLISAFTLLLPTHWQRNNISCFCRSSNKALERKSILRNTDKSVSLCCVWERRSKNINFISLSQWTILLPTAHRISPLFMSKTAKTPKRPVLT